jgi:predicted nucleic acid-binding protein
VKVTVDTNVLVRAVVCDEPVQAKAAAAILTDAESIAVTLLAAQGQSARLL